MEQTLFPWAVTLLRVFQLWGLHAMLWYNCFVHSRLVYCSSTACHAYIALPLMSPPSYSHSGGPFSVQTERMSAVGATHYSFYSRHQHPHPALSYSHISLGRKWRSHSGGNKDGKRHKKKREKKRMLSDRRNEKKRGKKQDKVFHMCSTPLIFFLSLKLMNFCG